MTGPQSLTRAASGDEYSDGLGVPHAFLSNKGGQSDGVYAGLNCGLGSEDDRDVILANRAIACGRIAPKGGTLVSLYQVHSALAVRADRPFDTPPKADAVVTKTPGLVLSVLTADCAPILLADEEAGIVAAAHAGWRGAVGGVTDATLHEMQAMGADISRITAAIGPCIAAESYEVASDMREAALRADAEAIGHFTEGRDDRHFHFDLRGYVAARLARAGIGRLYISHTDTYRSTQHYSYRRATHQQAPDYGRQLSGIALPTD